MTTEIIQFPTKSVRDWEHIKKLMSKHIVMAGLTEKESLEFLSIVKPIYESFNLEHEIPKPPDSSAREAVAIYNNLSNFVASVQQHIAKVLSETLLRELRHYTLIGDEREDRTLFSS